MQIAKPTVAIEIITPQIAKEYFQLNVERNKNIRPADVDKLKNDILRDRWQLTNDAISFNKEGRLINGQHRLLACMAADRPILVFVARGLEDSSMEVIDSGCSRTLNDRIRISGVGDTRAALRNTTVQSLINKIFRQIYPGNSHGKISISEMTEIFDKYRMTFETINKLTNQGHGMKKTAIRNKEFAFAALSAMCHGVSEQSLLTFIEVVVKKDAENAIRMGYNYKAALQYDVDFVQLAGYGSMGKNDRKCFLATKAIYCFVNNKKRMVNEDPYPMSIQRLDMLESRLRRWSEQKGA